MQELQWGHGESAVENIAAVAMSPDERQGFNGATANPPGKASNRLGSHRGVWSASMGPRRIRRGKHLRPFPHQKRLFPLQWGHGESAVENAFTLQQWQQAMTQLQWGHGESAVENPVHRPTYLQPAGGFTGATANPPWKTP